MNPNLYTLPVYDAGISLDHLEIGIPTKLLVVKPRDGDVGGEMVKGRGLYVGRTNGSLEDDQGYRAVVWKGSGAVWESEENGPTHMGRAAIAGTLGEGQGVRDFTLSGQVSGDQSQILRFETGPRLPKGASKQDRMRAFTGFMQKHGVPPEPHGAFALAPEVLELSFRETEDSDNQVAATEATRLSSTTDRAIAAGSGVSWGRRYVFFLPKGAGVLVKGAVPGVLFRVVNVGGRLEIRKPQDKDLEVWYQLEALRAEKAAARRRAS